ncbi:MAG: PDGLE domain-containing protein [Nocardioides sp.]
MKPGSKRRRAGRHFFVLCALITLAIAGGLSYYASGHPDGLEFVAGKAGFLDRANDSATADGPFADYSTKGIEDARLSGGVAGVVGVLVVAVVARGLFALLRRRTPTVGAPGSGRDGGP